LKHAFQQLVSYVFNLKFVLTVLWHWYTDLSTTRLSWWEWERKCESRFSRSSSSKTDRFTSNQDQNDQRAHSTHYLPLHFVSASAIFVIICIL